MKNEKNGWIGKIAPVFKYPRSDRDIPGLDASLINRKWVKTSEVENSFWEIK